MSGMFQPREGGNVDAVAHQIAVSLLDNVAEMHADPELNAALGRQASVALDQASPLARKAFLAVRRTATMLQIPALSGPGGPTEMFLVNPDELAAAFEADRVAA